MNVIRGKEIKTGKPMRKRTVRRIKRILLGVEIFFALIVISMSVVAFVPGVKENLIKGMTGTSIGRSILGWFGRGAYDENVRDKDFNQDNIITNDNIDKNKVEKYTQILVIGIDARGSEFDTGSNSDSMIVVTVNNETDEVTMVSVYRDTLMLMVDNNGVVQEGSYNKANAAYSKWGIQGTINTLNTNLDLHITDYAILNFEGVAKLVDAMNGIDVNLTQGEVYQLNEHLADTKLSTGLYAPNVTNPGLNHLVGLQVTTYCRIRKTTYYDEKTGEAINDDYGRAARQRAVILKLIDKAKKMGLTQTLDVGKLVLNSNTEGNKIVKTSMTWDEIVTLVSVAFDFKMSGSQGYPEHNVADYFYVPGFMTKPSIVVAKGTQYNVQKLHEFIYGIKDYQTSDRIITIDQEIKNITGVQTHVDSEDTSESGSDVVPGL